MAVVILEGARGTGKTTLGKAIKELTGWPLFKGFYSGVGHNPGEHDPRIAQLKLPIKSWVEDMFFADLLATAKPNIIMDRAMPTGIAYTEMSAEDKHAALGMWADRMRAAEAKIILLHAGPEACDMRAADRTYKLTSSEESHRILTNLSIANAPFLVLDTTEQTPADILKAALLYIGTLCQHRRREMRKGEVFCWDCTGRWPTTFMP